MTTLATSPLCEGQLDLLTQLADTDTPLGSLRFEDFRSACEWDGFKHGGVVHPSRVSALLHGRFGEVNPRTLSAWWAASCGSGKNGFMDKTDIEAPIDPQYSRGNGNKAVKMRRLRAARKATP